MAILFILQAYLKDHLFSLTLGPRHFGVSSTEVPGELRKDKREVPVPSP